MSEGKRFVGILLGITLAVIGLMLVLVTIFSLSTDQWIRIVPAVISAIGLCGAAYGWLHASTLKRTESIMQLDEKFRSDSGISNAMYSIDYDLDWYSEYFHRGNRKQQDDDKEQQFDKMFSCLTFICHLMKNKMISNIEFDIFEYRIKRVCNSPQAQHYLWNLYHFSKARNMQSSFHALIDYMRMEVFDEIERDKFDSPNSSISEHEKYLIF